MVESQFACVCQWGSHGRRQTLRATGKPRLGHSQRGTRSAPTTSPGWRWLALGRVGEAGQHQASAFSIHTAIRARGIRARWTRLSGRHNTAVTIVIADIGICQRKTPTRCLRGAQRRCALVRTWGRALHRAAGSSRHSRGRNLGVRLGVADGHCQRRCCARPRRHWLLM